MAALAYNRSLHFIALFTAAATFPLIFMGGLVTSHGAGLSVPDWPNSWGYNMFLFPPRLWIGGILYEHTHRLMGTVVGMLSIALVYCAWRTEPRRWVRWLAVGVLGAVCIQGTLGGLRVTMLNIDLAIIHACFAQAFFCLTALMAIVTSRWWIDPPGAAQSGSSSRQQWLIAGAVMLVCTIYMQLIVGAVMRHNQAGLAIPDFPLSYGKLLPPTHLSAGELHRIKLQRYRAGVPADVTIQQMWIHFAHRIGAAVVSIAVIGVAALCIWKYRRQPALLYPAILLLLLLSAQVALGVLTVLWKKPADIASAHVAVGALLLVTSFVLAVRSFRIYWPVRLEHAVPLERRDPSHFNRNLVPA